MDCRRDLPNLRWPHDYDLGNRLMRVSVPHEPLDEETSISYIKKYNEGGAKVLTNTNYHGWVSFLNDKQINQLCEELESQIYLTTSSVIEYVKNAFDVTYTMGGMRDLFHRMGYEFKKPKLSPDNPDMELQEEFVAYYEAYMQEKPADTEIY